MKRKMDVSYAIDVDSILANMLDEKDDVIGFVVYKAIKALDPVVKGYTEKRNQLITKYGTKNEDGTYTMSKDNEHFAEYSDEADKALSEVIEVDMPDMTQKNFDALVKDKGLSGREIFTLENVLLKDKKTK